MEHNVMSNYKIQTKIGQAEFCAEGTEDSVRADYDRFLNAVASRPVDNGAAAGIDDSVSLAGERGG